MWSLPSSCALVYICVPPPSQALHRGVFVVFHSRGCVSSRWQLPKVLNTPLRECRCFGAFVLCFLRSAASILCPVISNPLMSLSLRWCRGGAVFSPVECFSLEELKVFRWLLASDVSYRQLHGQAFLSSKFVLWRDCVCVGPFIWPSVSLLHANDVMCTFGWTTCFSLYYSHINIPEEFCGWQFLQMPVPNIPSEARSWLSSLLRMESISKTLLQTGWMSPKKWIWGFFLIYKRQWNSCPL